MFSELTSAPEFGDLPDLLFTEELLLDLDFDRQDGAGNTPASPQHRDARNDDDDDDCSKKGAVFSPLPPVKIEEETFNSWMEETADLQQMADYRQLVAEASPAASDDAQTLIDEMEEFLAHHEGLSGSSGSPQPSVSELEEGDEDGTVAAMEQIQPLANSTLATDEILDALVTGNVSTNDDSGYESVKAGGGSGLESLPQLTTISNVSEFYTDDGQKIVIVIANDVAEAAPSSVDTTTTICNAVANPPAASASPMLAAAPLSPVRSDSARWQPEVTASPGASSFDEEMEEYEAVDPDTSDSDWTPDTPPAARQKRKVNNPKSAGAVARARENRPKKSAAGRVQKRGAYKRSTYHGIKDKKERKKMQNVEAARRYRDKKKNEQGEKESEEQLLEKKNIALKGQLSEMEHEMATLKKLMAELGLIKVST